MKRTLAASEQELLAPERLETPYGRTWLLLHRRHIEWLEQHACDRGDPDPSRLMGELIEAAEQRERDCVRTRPVEVLV